MPYVKQRLRVRRALTIGNGTPNDCGAVATVFAVLLAGGVLLGTLALVVDIGQLYVEREELQSGADAAALAVAKACANDNAGCATRTSIAALAQEYADINAKDTVSSVQEICGYRPGRLSPCSAPATNLTACLGSPPPVPTFYVEVRVRTQVPDGTFVLPPTFAQAMAGNEDFDGATVGACARAMWEPTAGVLAMTIATCEFEAATSDGFALEPPYPPDPAPGDEHTIHFRDDSPVSCPTDPSDPYWQEPDTAGFLDGDAGCLLTMPADGEVWGDDLVAPDFLPPAPCETRLSTVSAARDVVLVPVHDANHPEIGQTEYRHIYVAPFVVTGYYFGASHSSDSWLTSQAPCADDQRCVSGVFVGPAVALNSLSGTSILTLIG